MVNAILVGLRVDHLPDNLQRTQSAQGGECLEEQRVAHGLRILAGGEGRRLAVGKQPHVAIVLDQVEGSVVGVNALSGRCYAGAMPCRSNLMQLQFGYS